MKKIIITILTLSTIALHSQSYKRTDINVDNTLYVDGVNNRVGIGTTSPNAKLNVEGGDVNFDSGTLFVDASTNRVGTVSYTHLRAHET